MSPKCSSVVVITSSPAPRSSPASTMLQPSVVDAVSATCSADDADERGDLAAKLLARLEQPRELRELAATLVERRSPRPRASPRSSRARAARRCPPAGRRSRSSTGNCARASSNVTRGILPTPRLTFAADARRHRRSARVHAALRPLAVPRRSRAREPTSSSSRRAFASAPSRAPEGYDGARVVLSALVAHGLVAAAPAVKALEHPFGMARFALAKPDVIHVQWLGAPEARSLALPSAQPCRFHRARHHPAAHALEDGDVAHALRSLRARRRALRARTRAARRLRHRRGEAARHPPPRLPLRGRRGRTTGARRSASGSSGRTREPRTPSRRCSASTALDSSSSAIRACRSTASSAPPATARSGGSATCPTRSCAVRSRRRRSRSFPYRAEIDVSGALLQVLGAGVPAIVYDIGGLGEVVGRFGAGAVVPPGDVDAMSAALARLLGDARGARSGPRRRRARARGAHLGRVGRRSPRALPRARVIFRRRRFRELVERQLDLFASRDGAARRGRRRGRGVDERRRRRVRGAVRRLPARRRRDRRAPPRDARDVRGDARRRAPPTSTAPRSTEPRGSASDARGVPRGCET